MPFNLDGPGFNAVEGCLDEGNRKNSCHQISVFVELLPEGYQTNRNVS